MGKWQSEWGPIFPEFEATSHRDYKDVASLGELDEEAQDEKLLIIKSPEAKLFLMVIMRALFDAIRSQKLIRDSARDWIASNSTAEFSLIWYARQISPKPEGLIRYCRKFVADNPTPEKNKRKVPHV